MSDAPSGTLYVGLTAKLAMRVKQHRAGAGSAFCRKYGLHRLVYIEQHDSIRDAIAREKALKAWQRVWKLNLIARMNPEWDDLFETLNA